MPFNEELAVALIASDIERAIRHSRADGAVWLVQMGAVGETALPQIGRELAEAGIELAQGGRAQRQRANARRIGDVAAVAVVERDEARACRRVAALMGRLAYRADPQSQPRLYGVQQARFPHAGWPDECRGVASQATAQ